MLEALVDAAIYGPHLHEPLHLRAIAQALYSRLEGDLQAGACPPGVRLQLLDRADALAEIDSQPGALKPAIRSVVQSPLRDDPNLKP